MNTPPSVWIVDDDASIRWVLDKALSGAGWQTTLFDNAGDVLRQVQCGNPDVIITDIRMPGTDGLELLQYLNERTPSLPVIVMTAHTNPNNALSAYQAGAFGYLPKPFDLDEAVDLRRLCSGDDLFLTGAVPAIGDRATSRTANRQAATGIAPVGLIASRT